MYKIESIDVEKIKKAMRRNKKNVNAHRRLLAVRLRGEGKTNEQIARITDFNPDWVGKLCKVYSKQGVEGLISDGRKGGNNRNMTKEEAEKFLEQFEKNAEAGQINTVREIAEKYDKMTGKKHKSHSTVYYMLHNAKWRKIVPKHQHPEKASDEAIEASKKLTLK